MAKAWVIALLGSGATLLVAASLVGAYELGRASADNGPPVATPSPADVAPEPVATSADSTARAADLAKQACTASEAPTRYAAANHTDMPADAVAAAQDRAVALAANAAQVDVGWKDLLDALDRARSETFAARIGAPTSAPAGVQAYLHVLTVECLRSGYVYGS